MHLNIFLLLILILFGCGNSGSDIEKWKEEIIEAETAFSNLAQEEGLAKAFEFYAAEEGAIRRGKSVVKGKAAIGEWYEKDARPNETLSWSPTFVDVSKSGDMGYTYGNYVFISTDSLGNKKESTGIFHTVWKRQADGNWKFVYD